MGVVADREAFDLHLYVDARPNSSRQRAVFGRSLVESEHSPALSLLDQIENGRPRWHRQAACRGMDPADWYPSRGDNSQYAKAWQWCRDCPVRAECLHQAVQEYSAAGQQGIWGGVSARGRRRYIRGFVDSGVARTAITVEMIEQFPPREWATP